MTTSRALLVYRILSLEDRAERMEQLAGQCHSPSMAECCRAEAAAYRADAEALRGESATW